MTKICTIENCENQHYAKGYCRKHYIQIQRYGRLTPETEKGRHGVCIVEGCNNKHKAQGYCSKHYQQVHKHGRLTPEREKKLHKICKFDICANVPIAKGLCAKHYAYIRRKQQKIIMESRIARTCMVEGNNEYNEKGYCRKHYNQVLRHGGLTPERERNNC